MMHNVIEPRCAAASLAEHPPARWSAGLSQIDRNLAARFRSPGDLPERTSACASGVNRIARRHYRLNPILVANHFL
jgi:hypothetical protein